MGFIKNLVSGYARAKEEQQAVQKFNIKKCHESMEEFHNTLSDTLLQETGEGLAKQPEQVRTGLVIYEIQAALAAAERFRLDRQYHRDFAAATLARGGMPPNMAIGMVDATLQSSPSSAEAIRQIPDGAEGYELLTLGTDSLAQHVKDTLRKLQAISS